MKNKSIERDKKNVKYKLNKITVAIKNSFYFLLKTIQVSTRSHFFHKKSLFPVCKNYLFYKFLHKNLYSLQKIYFKVPQFPNKFQFFVFFLSCHDFVTFHFWVFKFNSRDKEKNRHTARRQQDHFLVLLLFRI